MSDFVQPSYGERYLSTPLFHDLPEEEVVHLNGAKQEIPADLTSSKNYSSSSGKPIYN